MNPDRVGPEAQQDEPAPSNPGPTGHDHGGVEVTLRDRRLVLGVLVVCIGAELALLLLDYHVNYGRLSDHSSVRGFFNTAREDGLASWFGVTQTMLVALTLWLIYITVRARAASRGVRLGWLVIALLFSYLALDDGTKLHERVGSVFEAAHERSAAAGDATSFGGRVLEAFPSYPWQFLFMPVFGALGLFMLVFLWRQLGERRGRVLLLAALSCLVVAVGLDFVEGLDPGHRWNLYTIAADRFELEAWSSRRFDRDAFATLRHFSKSTEEVVEMLGMTLFWVAFLRHWAAGEPRVRLVGEGNRPTPADVGGTAGPRPPAARGLRRVSTEAPARPTVHHVRL